MTQGNGGKESRIKNDAQKTGVMKLRKPCPALNGPDFGPDVYKMCENTAKKPPVRVPVG